MSDIDFGDPYLTNSCSSPSSSPPSSPALGSTVDSSPPSSPGIGPVATPPPSPGPSDPYAASTKATRRPKLYEKRSKALGWGCASGLPQHNDATRTRAKAYIYIRRDSVDRSSENDGGTGNTQPQRDPYAATAKSDWKPPQREKKWSRVSSTDSTISSSSILSSDTADNTSQTQRRERDMASTDADSDGLNLTDEEARPLGRHASLEAREEEVWEKAITDAIDTANGHIFLQNTSLMAAPLTYISSSIADLAGLVVFSSRGIIQPAAGTPSIQASRPFIRSVTVPTSSSLVAPFLSEDSPRKGLQKMGSTGLIRTATSALLSNPAPGSQNEIQLLLSGNVIRSLPLELFQLSGLTVLALRSNRISVIPPQIVQLTSLRELNLVFNKLRWLPSEMLGMQPMTLFLSGNPWHQPPPLPDVTDAAQQVSTSRSTLRRRNSEAKQKRVSPTTVHFVIPPLAELCLRLLLTPFSPPTITADGQSQRRPETVLEAIYALPLPGTIPDSVLNTLRACLPAAVAKPAETASPAKRPRRQPAVAHSSRADPDEQKVAKAEENPPALSVCPSPAHRTADGGWMNGRVPVFVRHAEERFTWEREVAGADVRAECGGAGVPVRWRGCGKGCMDFLNDEKAGQDDMAREDTGMVEDAEVSGSPSDHEMEEGSGVRVVQFVAGGLADVDDFD